MSSRARYEEMFIGVATNSLNFLVRKQEVFNQISEDKEENPYTDLVYIASLLTSTAMLKENATKEFVEDIITSLITCLNTENNKNFDLNDISRTYNIIIGSMSMLEDDCSDFIDRCHVKILDTINDIAKKQNLHAVTVNSVKKTISDTTTSFFYNQAAIARQDTDFEKAFNYVDKADSYTKCQFRSHYERGCLYFQQENYQKSLDEFSKIDIDNDVASAIWAVNVLQYTAVNHFRLGDYEKALDLKLESFKRNPNQSFCPTIYGQIQDLIFIADKCNKFDEISEYINSFVRTMDLDTSATLNLNLVKSQNRKKGESAPKKSILGITFDLKYSKEDGVRLCEANSLASSGLSGYKAAYNHDLRDDLSLLYKDFSSLGDANYRDHTKGDRFNGKSRSKASVMFQIIEDQIAPPLGYNNTQFEHYVTTMFKDLFIEKFAKKYPDLFPKSDYFAKDDFEAEMGAFLDQLNDDALVVIKPSNACVGDGVILVNKEDALDKARDLFKRRTAENESDTYLINDSHPTFIVQECAKSDPVVARDDRSYEGTMRIVVNTIFDHETGEVTPHFSGAYWKLPSLSLEEKDTLEDPRDVLFSQPPSKLKKENKTDEARPFSAKVDDETFTAVTTALHDLVIDYTKTVHQKTQVSEFLQNACDMFNDPTSSPSEVLSMMSYLSSMEVGPLVEYNVINEDPETYTRFFRKMEEIAVGSGHNHPEYVRDFAKAVIGEKGIKRACAIRQDLSIPSKKDEKVTDTYLTADTKKSFEMKKWRYKWWA